MTPIRIEILSLQGSRVPAAGNAGHWSHQTFGNLNPVLSTTASHLPPGEEGLHNVGLCFLMVAVRPGNRIFGRRWEQI